MYGDHEQKWPWIRLLDPSKWIATDQINDKPWVNPVVSGTWSTQRDPCAEDYTAWIDFD